MMSRLTPLEGTTMVTWLALVWTCRRLSSSETQKSEATRAAARAIAHRSHPANGTAARNFLPRCADPRPERAPLFGKSYRFKKRPSAKNRQHPGLALNYDSGCCGFEFHRSPQLRAAKVAHPGAWRTPERQARCRSAVLGGAGAGGSQRARRDPVHRPGVPAPAASRPAAPAHRAARVQDTGDEAPAAQIQAGARRGARLGRVLRLAGECARFSRVEVPRAAQARSGPAPGAAGPLVARIRSILALRAALRA